MMQRLPGTFSLRANADYFSSIVTQQTYQQDITRATNRNRRFGSYVTGRHRRLSGQRRLPIGPTTSTRRRRSRPTGACRASTSAGRSGRSPRSPVYVGVQGEYVTLLRSSTVDDVQTQDQGLTRFDVAPTVRVPFNRWPFLGINTAVTWRATYWTERLQMQPVPTVTAVQVDEGVARQYFDFSVRATGPVFNRIFNPPEGKEGTKYKHVIQPSVTLQKVTNFDVFDQIVKLESGDYTIGRTQVTYDLTNRLYAKKDVAREIVSLSVNQSYYTDARAAQYDQQYQSSFTAKRATNFSPVALQFRASPSDRLQGDFRTEWDPDRARAAQHRGERQLLERQLAERIRRLEPAPLHPRAAGLRRSEPVRPVHQLDGQHPRLAQQVRRQLLVQLRRQERSLPQPALGRLLTTPSAAASVSSTRPSTCRARSCRRTSRRTAASTSRSRWPASAPSRTCSARSAGSRAADDRAAAGSLSSQVRPDSPAAICVEHLLEHEARVAAWGHGPVPPASRASERVSWTTVDITDAEAVTAALAETRPSAVFHCAGIADVHSTWSDSATALRVNVIGTHNLLTALERLELDAPVLITGSALVYRPSDTALSEDSPIGPTSPYGVSKLAQELVGLAARGRVIVTRPFNHAGPRQAPAYVTSSFARQIVEAEAGIREPVLRGRQSRRAPRHHRRARYGARLPAADGERAGRTPLQRVPG